LRTFRISSITCLKKIGSSILATYAAGVVLDRFEQKLNLSAKQFFMQIPHTKINIGISKAVLGMQNVDRQTRPPQYAFTFYTSSAESIRNKKFRGELIAYFPFMRHRPHRKRGRCLATLGGIHRHTHTHTRTAT
jgi:hypothetical protein